jgi:hypothetical protein
MKISVLCDKSGNIQSVAMINQPPAGQIRLEADGGGTVHAIEIAPNEMDAEALMGKKGIEAQKAAHEKLRKRF